MSSRVRVLVLACSVCVGLRHLPNASSALLACWSGPYAELPAAAANAGLSASKTGAGALGSVAPGNAPAQLLAALRPQDLLALTGLGFFN